MCSLTHRLTLFATIVATILVIAPTGRAQAICDVTGTWSATHPAVALWHLRESPGGVVTGAVYSADRDPAEVYFLNGARSGATLAFNISYRSLGSVGFGTMPSCDTIEVSIVGMGTFELTRSSASYCGDSVLDGGEDCDDGNFTSGDTCTATCTESVCGNRVVEPGEQCDDGNPTEVDGCSNTCAANSCGNAITDPGEDCDDGNQVNGDGCSNGCAVNLCGNSTLESGEVCDQGDVTPGDGCSATCQFEGCTLQGRWTGSSAIWNLRENPDGTLLGNTHPIGSSTTGVFTITGGARFGNTATLIVDGALPISLTQTSCDGATLAIPGVGTIAIAKLSTSHCGDLVLDAGEQCDDGNFVNGDTCTVACRPAACGNSILEPGEQCDDGNVEPVDGCSATCIVNDCSNGTVESGEQCDDANVLNGDGCSTSCQANACGDGLLQSGESCDDGDTADGDGCSALCQSEGCTVTGFWQVTLSGVAYLSLTEAGGVVSGHMIDPALNTVSPLTPGTRAGAHLTFGVPFNGNTLPASLTMTSCDAFIGSIVLPASGIRLRSSVCGDGVWASDEPCDDGNLLPNDWCSSICGLTQCGDGNLDPFEACDDGNPWNTDACRVGCVAATCGDGFVRSGVEQCDDGNAADADACTTACSVNTCGDGFVLDGIEACDDGNLVAADGCDAKCNTEDVAAAAIGASGGQVTTDREADGATVTDPVETSVQVPALGSPSVVAIAETGAASPPTGYAVIGKQVKIQAPEGTAISPLVLTFEIDASILGAATAATVQVFRNGSLVPECEVGASTFPAACVFHRAILADGDARLTVKTPRASEWDFAVRLPLPGATEAACRKEFRKLLRNAFKAQATALQVCADAVDKGRAPGPCPDAKAIVAIDKAVTKVDPTKLAKKCPDAVVQALDARGDCASATTAAALAACIVSESRRTADEAITLAYGNAPAPLPSSAAQKCQERIAKDATKGLLSKRLQLIAACQNKLDLDKANVCPDAKTTTALASAEQKVLTALAAACSAPVLPQLGTFAAPCDGAITSAALAACQIAAHDEMTAPLSRLLP